MEVIEDEHELPAPLAAIKRRYKTAQEDLAYVVNQHELSFRHIKGSRKGLTLSVSLFETNSRTFHRLLDCHYNNNKKLQTKKYADNIR